MSKQHMKDKMAAIADKLGKTPSKPVIQETNPVTQQEQQATPAKQTKDKEETPFHVYLPTELLWSIKELGLSKRMKIKDIFVKALTEYVEKQSSI